MSFIAINNCFKRECGFLKPILDPTHLILTEHLQDFYYAYFIFYLSITRVPINQMSLIII
jgi:hypothetical protein